MSKVFHQPLGGNEMPRFGGPGTMMRLPARATAAGLDACFVGVPLDIGTSNRSGTRFGPRQIRAALHSGKHLRFVILEAAHRPGGAPAAASRRG